jgi:hypothetical protein
MADYSIDEDIIDRLIELMSDKAEAEMPWSEPLMKEVLVISEAVTQIIRLNSRIANLMLEIVRLREKAGG